jgi:hypothetical protein
MRCTRRILRVTCGKRANAISNWRAASTCVAWLLVTMRMSRIASSLTLAIADPALVELRVRGQEEPRHHHQQHQASSRTRRLKYRVNTIMPGRDRA